MDKNEIASVAYRYVTSGGVCADPTLCVANSLSFGISGDHMRPSSIAVTAGGSSGTTSTSSSAVSMTVS